MELLTTAGPPKLCTTMYFTHPLNVLQRDKRLEEELLELELLVELPDRVQHVLPLLLELLAKVPDLLLGGLELVPHLLQLPRLALKLRTKKKGAKRG